MVRRSRQISSLPSPPACPALLPTADPARITRKIPVAQWEERTTNSGLLSQIAVRKKQALVLLSRVVNLTHATMGSSVLYIAMCMKGLLDTLGSVHTTCATTLSVEHPSVCTSTHGSVILCCVRSSILPTFGLNDVLWAVGALSLSDPSKTAPRRVDLFAANNIPYVASCWSSSRGSCRPSKEMSNACWTRGRECLRG